MCEAGEKVAVGEHCPDLLLAQAARES